MQRIDKHQVEETTVVRVPSRAREEHSPQSLEEGSLICSSTRRSLLTVSMTGVSSSVVKYCKFKFLLRNLQNHSGVLLHTTVTCSNVKAIRDDFTKIVLER